MKERSFDEMIAYFNRRVSEMDIDQDYKMELLGMVTALGYKHEKTAHPEMDGQIRWERDMAISQLRELGYGLGEKMHTDGDTISRQAAIEALCEECSGNCIPCHSFPCGEVEALQKLPSAQQWIPCSERLPEEDNETGNGVQYSNAVLITVFNKSDDETIIDFAHTADGTWYSYVSDCSIPHGWKVLAWMPLPEPFAERKDNELV